MLLLDVLTFWTLQLLLKYFQMYVIISHVMVGFYLNVAIKGEWDANISSVGTSYHLKQIRT